ncbi:MAG: DsbA family protein [Candidatus Micrarchaeota archaeon]
MKNAIDSFLKEPFNRNLAFTLIAIGVILLAAEYLLPHEAASDGGFEIHFFYSPSCPHCAAQEPFNALLLEEFENVSIVRHNVMIAEESRLLLIMAQDYGVGQESLGTPTTFIGNRIFIGFVSQETTGKEMREALFACLSGECENATAVSPADSTSLTDSVDLPFFGRTDLSDLSLPLLTAVLGLLDGFNPCAMWVLVYLISLLMNVNDKKRMALVVGVFLLASGILYFLLMSAWLNAFLLLGYVRIVTVTVGLVALGAGVLSLKEFLDTRGAMVCKATDEAGRKKLLGDMRHLVSSPLTWATFFGIVALAFAVNSLEFVCSAAIPAVFTQVLALSDLSPLEHYGYIALYDLFFMLDDLLIFGSALLIMGNVGDKYARYCKIIGGIIMLILGLMLLFAPRMLA